MSLNRYDKKRDANEKEIFDTLKGLGLSVYPLDRPVDGVAGFQGLTRLFEVKMPRNKKNEPEGYTPAQQKFVEVWKGNNITPLVTVEDARKFALKMRKDAFMLSTMGLTG